MLYSLQQIYRLQGECVHIYFLPPSPHLEGGVRERVTWGGVREEGDMVDHERGCRRVDHEGGMREEGDMADHEGAMRESDDMADHEGGG